MSEKLTLSSPYGVMGNGTSDTNFSKEVFESVSGNMKSLYDKCNTISEAYEVYGTIHNAFISLNQKMHDEAVNRIMSERDNSNAPTKWES